MKAPRLPLDHSHMCFETYPTHPRCVHAKSRGQSAVAFSPVVKARPNACLKTCTATSLRAPTAWVKTDLSLALVGTSRGSDD